MKHTRLQRVWTDATHVHAETIDGRRASYAFSAWPRISAATDEQRHDYFLSYGGIHWPQIDEDLSFNGMFRDGLLLSEDEQIVWEDVADKRTH